jgi:hypothetical protein
MDSAKVDFTRCFLLHVGLASTGKALVFVDLAASCVDLHAPPAHVGIAPTHNIKINNDKILTTGIPLEVH